MPVPTVWLKVREEALAFWALVVVPIVRVSKPPLMRVAVGFVTVEKAVPLRRTVAVIAGEAGRLPLGTWTKARVARVPPTGMVKVETKLGVWV